MAGTREYTRSFAGGEISPEMYGRIDDAKFQTGAATLRNFLALPTGPAQNRAGFAFVKATKNNGKARLIPFTFSLNQTMVVELGDQYARFHTNGATLVYNPASLAAWRPPSPDLVYTYTSPAVITWNAHGLATGDPIRFYQSGTSGTVPTGLKFSYTYTVQRIDANSFNILDANGNPVAFTGGAGPGTVTNYPGAGTPGASINLSPNQSNSVSSAAVGGLANVPTGAGGVVTLNVDLTASVYRYQSSGLGIVQYSNDGGISWNTFYGAGSSISTSVSQQIALSNLNLLQLRVHVSGQAGPSGSIAIDLTVNSWSVDVPTSGGGGGGATLRAYRYYTASDAVTYGGSSWVSVMADSGGVTVPGTNAAIWYQLPADGTYEIPTPYAAADLFSIRYAQSADVLTLVHTSYPPAELKRLSATQWSLTNIVFGPPLATPASVAAAASPGYLAKISTISLANPALITTAAPHTLSLADGVYIANLTAVIGGVNTVIDNFYMVSKVPLDGGGLPITTQLNLMDYSGNPFDTSGWASYHATDGAKPITIQIGSKIFNITNEYAVQALASDGVSSSELSDSASVLNNLNVPGSYNTISWAAIVGAASYNVFKRYNGLWGFVGTTQALSFVDNNIATDFSIVPGVPDLVFASEGNYPGSVCYFQQRRCFGGTTNGPDNCWMTNSGTEKMMSYSLPSLATDRIAFRVAALKADRILHLCPMTQLILLTSETEYALTPTNGDVLTPSTIDPKPQSYIGAAEVQPTIINTSMVYAAARGGHVRELGYAWTVNGFQTGDLSLRAAHLFDNLTIIDQAYSKSPKPIIWFVSSSGKLLGLTYIPEEQLGAWHQHDTQGTFESICCVAEGDEDFLYAVINRTIGGNTVRYVERMASRVIDKEDPSTWFFVDAGINQTFVSPVTLISGLDWLEGAVVKVVADGFLQADKTVVGGIIKLDRPSTQVVIGLEYVSDLFTLPPVMQIPGFGQGTNKNISRAWVKVYQSSQLLVGPDEDHLEPVKQRTNEPWGTPQSLKSEDLEVLLDPLWQQQGQVLIRQVDPLPLEVVALTLEVTTGG
jgi:hypothetical protein